MTINYKEIADRIYLNFDVRTSKKYYDVLINTVRELYSLDRDSAEGLTEKKSITPKVREYINRQIKQCIERHVPPRVSWYVDDKEILLGRGFNYQDASPERRRRGQCYVLIDEIWVAIHDRLTPQQFEKFCGNYFTLFKGYEDFKITGRSGDGGIDFEGKKKEPYGGAMVVGQAKRYAKSIFITKRQVDRFWGDVLSKYSNVGSRILVFVTTSDFRAEARGFAREKTINLIDGEQIAHTLALGDVCIIENEEGAPCFSEKKLLDWLET